MNKKIKELLEKYEGVLRINEFCRLKFYMKNYLNDDNNGKGYLLLEFNCYYGKACHQIFIDTREPNEIREIIVKEQTFFFMGLNEILNNMVKNNMI